MNLTLNLKGEYFDAIKAGEKTEEFRLVTPYWTHRIVGKEFEGIVLLCGYPKKTDDSRRLELPWRGYCIRQIEHPHFGPHQVNVYAIRVAK